MSLQLKVKDIEGNPVEDNLTVEVVLSEKNLLALLTKIKTDWSACTIVKGEDNGQHLIVRGERDEVHYAARPAGVMHPVTEQEIRDIHADHREDE